MSNVRNNLVRDKHNVGMGTFYLGAFTSRMEYDEDLGREIECMRQVASLRAYWGCLGKTITQGIRARRQVRKAARNYLGGKLPDDYKCDACGKTGIKLWRQYQTCAPRLLCAPCACADQKKPDDVDEQGYRGRRRCDQIGWYVPAVPTEDGETYWGYTSVPEAGCIWWRRLPTRATVPGGNPTEDAP